MNENKQYLLGDVARILGVQPYRIVYLYSSQQLEEPARLGNRRVFSFEDMMAIAEKMGDEAMERVRRQDQLRRANNV